MKEISDKLYHQLKRLGVIDADTRSHNVGASDYCKHLFQPWTAWIEYDLNAFDADILKRVLRTKEGEDRITDYEKIIHICQERIRQLKFEKEIVCELNKDLGMTKIRKGDRFECIKTVVMDDGEIAYNEGNMYASDNNGCITDNQNEKNHIWQYDGDDCSWTSHFKRI